MWENMLVRGKPKTNPNPNPTRCNNQSAVRVKLQTFILDKFGNVLDGTKDMLYQMFLRKVSNDRHDITETEADFIATKKFVFWLETYCFRDG